MREGKVVLIAAGALTLLVALGTTGAGGALLWANATQRDATGYFNTPSARFESSGRALVSSVDFTMHPGPSTWTSYEPLGTIRVRASVQGGSTFVGIAPAAAVDAYLAGVAHDEVTSVRALPFRATYRFVAGTVTPAAPATRSFWVASASGSGTQHVTWKPAQGRWSLVVMRADANADVVAHVDVGTNTGLVVPLGIALTLGGLLLLVVGGLMLGLGVIGLGRSRRREAAAGAGREAAVSWPTGPPGQLAPHAYPARFDGQLDSPLSRWRWIFKWLFIVPHLIILAFLWMAVLPLTIVAGVSILFTGRYPESIFDFTVGVMRWTWRVVFYAYSALATDRYPPFTLEPDDTYPASFSVDYPQQLSRGLVLVKWWLLAIPQYVIVGFFAGGGIGLGWRHSNSWSIVAGGGAIGLLVFVAALLLLFTGRYPQPLFEFVMGMNRWCYRVLTYALLLRDEYPPFHFDAGGTDPGSVMAPVPAPSPEPTEGVGPGPGAIEDR